MYFLSGLFKSVRLCVCARDGHVYLSCRLVRRNRCLFRFHRKWCCMPGDTRCVDAHCRGSIQIAPSSSPPNSVHFAMFPVACCSNAQCNDIFIFESLSFFFVRPLPCFFRYPALAIPFLLDILFCMLAAREIGIYSERPTND